MKNKITKLFLVLMISGFTAQAQTEESKQEILKGTNVEFLNNFAKVEKEFSEKQYQIAVEVANRKGLPVKGVNEKGQNFEVVSYDPKTDNLFYMTTTNNISGASSVNTIKVGYLHSIGIKGMGMLIGEWDGNIARATHEALKPRVSERNAAGGTTVKDKDHASHVAGTMLANATAGPTNRKGQAMGMAPEASLATFDWNSDISEMATAATKDALLISNHSYGLDNKVLASNYGVKIFGRYTGTPTKQSYGIQTSRDYDIIANNAPYYTIVFAAGNDRDATPPLNSAMAQRDLLVNSGTSKNLVVVAAINGVANYTGASGVTMSSFSNWGPTDDFRVKPDISAKGVNVYSLLGNADDAYGIMSGTSMAAPSVTGAITLWQQLYKKKTNVYMRSSTVRALMAHTALEAGAQEGPDYMYGWGVFNTEGGALVIENKASGVSVIDENTLINGQIQEIKFSKKAQSDLTVTIAWNDPAGEETSNQTANFYAKALVNDLDVKIVNTDNNTEYFPYKLKEKWGDMQPASSNEKGVNSVDNIEKVFIANAPVGNYKVVVSNKGSLTGGNQLYSLVMTGHNGTLSVEEEMLNTLKVYPNPIKDYVMIEGDSQNLESSTINVYDASGRNILSKIIKSEQDLRIDTSSFSPGFYILNIEKNGASKTFKLIK